MSIRKVFYKEATVKGWVHEIIRSMASDGWRPDYIVGLTRGGLVPANLISQYLECPMETVKVSLRDDNSQPESNLWMAEDAYDGKNILIVDDINDSGATLNWIKQDWMSGCLPEHERWNGVWGGNVRIATLVDNEASASELTVSYSAVGLNKADEDVWICFPWEEFWK